MRISKYVETRFIALIDFSEYSPDLLRYAYDWSRKAGGNLIMVHNTIVVAPAMADPGTRTALAQVANEEALARMRKLAEEYLPDHSDIRYIASEQPIASIIAGLRNEPSESIVFMGVKGTGRLKQIFMGSFVIEVIDQADTIVVAMPRKVTSFVSDKIYVAVSDTSQLNTSALDTLLACVGDRIRELSFFSLTDSKFDLHAMEVYLSGLVRDYSDHVTANYQIFYEENVFDSLRSIINDKTNELLVVQRGSRSLTNQPLRKFIINELVYEGVTPLIVLP